VVADLDLSGEPKLVNKKTVYESKDRSCLLEAQDFYDNDTKMTFTCYEPQGHSRLRRRKGVEPCHFYGWKFHGISGREDE